MVRVVDIMLRAICTRWLHSNRSYAHHSIQMGRCDARHWLVTLNAQSSLAEAQLEHALPAEALRTHCSPMGQFAEIVLVGQLVD